jgi:hypothetical protein
MPQATTPLTHRITLAHLLEVDFWSRVARTDSPTDCREWAKGKNDRGYGVVHVTDTITGFGRAVALYAHRVAYSLHAGEIPDHGRVIDHLCYNTACCNPAHLELTTQLTNVRRGRKPLRKPTPFPRPDGTIRWQVRWYDSSGPKRRQLSRSFDSRAEAEAFAAANRAA